jgi:hypothetical protein
VIRSRLLTSPLPRSQVLGSPARRRTGRRPEPGYHLGRPGRPAEEPTLLIAIFDDSGSVISPAGTDPLSNRYGEATRAFAVVARKGARHELGAILHFDNPSSGDVGPVPITRRGLVTLRSGLRLPPDARGSSELGPSLRRAVELAEAHPGHRATLTVASDFLLMDPEPANVLSELAAFPGQGHAVVLGTRLPTGVLEEHITLTRVRRDDPPGAVARALFSSLVVHRPGGYVDQGM